MTEPNGTPAESPSGFEVRRLAVPLAKLVVVGLVAWFVSDAVGNAWRDLRRQQISFQPGWAIAAGGMLLVAQAPMAWFWWRTLKALGEPAALWRAVAAYYLSQIGKYVPGKAMVIAIRAERMVARGARAKPAAAAVFYETLTLMGAGGVLSAVLLAGRGGSDTGGPWLIALSLALAGACFAPTLPPVATWLVGRLTGDTEPAVRRAFSYRMMAVGWLASLVSWVGMAASVWMSARSVNADLQLPASFDEAAVWLLAATLPVVAGFLSLLPAGVVVRDGLMLRLLMPLTGEAGALAAALAVRVIWLAAEVLVCAILAATQGRGRRGGAAAGVSDG